MGKGMRGRLLKGRLFNVESLLRILNNGKKSALAGIDITLHYMFCTPITMIMTLPTTTVASFYQKCVRLCVDYRQTDTDMTH